MKSQPTSSPRTKPKPPEDADGKDFVAIAKTFAKAAIADKKRLRHGRWIQLAARRFLNDLKRAKEKGSPFIFSPEHANDCCDFLEKLPHVEGVWETPNIVLHPSHVFFCVNLFGFRKRDGTRRFDTALFTVARKNAKSLLASGVALYCLCCERENGPQVISAATTGQQARVIFDAARKIVLRESDLREAFGLEAWVHAISRVEVGGTFKPINAKASTQDGLNPSHVFIDEIHAHPSHDLLNVLASASGARKNLLFMYTTTEGYETPGPWPEIRHFSRQLLKGEVEADHFLAVYFSLDEADKNAGIEDDDPFDECKWVKANPLMDVNPTILEKMRQQATEAKFMPGRMAEFKIKRLNLPASSATPWIDLAAWDKCKEKFDLAFLEDHPCIMGLDLSSTQDLTSVRLVWDVDGVIYTWGKRYIPAEAVSKKTERGASAYAGWVQSGLVTQTEGNVIDGALIESDILKLFERFRPSEVAYDPWNARDLCNRLMDKGLPMVEFIQGPKSYHPAMQALEVAYMSGKLRHGGDPVLRWCAANLVVRYDVNLNMAPDKSKAFRKIDDMTALLMAIGRMVARKEKQLVIDETFEILTA